MGNKYIKEKISQHKLMAMGKDPVTKRLVTMRNELLAGKKSKKSKKKLED